MHDNTASNNSISQSEGIVNRENLSSAGGQVAEYARILKIGEQGVRDLNNVVNSMGEGIDVANVVQAYNAVYQMGKQGKDISEARNPHLNMLSTEQKDVAYNAGFMDSVTEKKSSGGVLQKDGVSEDMLDEADATQFSIANTLNMSWDDQLAKAKRSDTLVVSKTTPDVLTDKGINNRPLAIPQSIITKAQSGKDESHSISDANIKNLPTGVDNAVAIIDDRQRNSIVFITELTENGKPVVVSFLKDALFDGDTVHQATSVPEDIALIRAELKSQGAVIDLPAAG